MNNTQRTHIDTLNYNIWVPIEIDSTWNWIWTHIQFSRVDSNNSHDQISSVFFLHQWSDQLSFIGEPIPLNSVKFFVKNFERQLIFCIVHHVYWLVVRYVSTYHKLVAFNKWWQSWKRWLCDIVHVEDLLLEIRNRVWFCMWINLPARMLVYYTLSAAINIEYRQAFVCECVQRLSNVQL